MCARSDVGGGVDAIVVLVRFGGSGGVRNGGEVTSRDIAGDCQ